MEMHLLVAATYWKEVCIKHSKHEPSSAWKLFFHLGHHQLVLQLFPSVSWQWWQSLPTMWKDLTG
jgi:hypothetical protein